MHLLKVGAVSMVSGMSTACHTVSMETVSQDGKLVDNVTELHHHDHGSNDHIHINHVNIVTMVTMVTF